MSSFSIKPTRNNYCLASYIIIIMWQSQVEMNISVGGVIE